MGYPILRYLRNEKLEIKYGDIRNVCFVFFFNYGHSETYFHLHIDNG